MSVDVVAAQYYAMRAQVDAMGIALGLLPPEQVSAAVPDQGEQRCLHLGEKKDLGSTLGRRREQCLECGAILES